MKLSTKLTCNDKLPRTPVFEEKAQGKSCGSGFGLPRMPQGRFFGFPVVPSFEKLIFTSDDGRKIGPLGHQLSSQASLQKASVKKFVFHNYRNTALTEWARQGIHVDVAMKSSGHTSIEMRKRYLDLKPSDVAAAFGTGKDKNGAHCALSR